MTSIVRAVLVIGLLSLCNVGTALAAAPVSETKPAASTVATWRGYIAAFKKFIGHNDPTKVTKADVIRWKDELVAAGRQGIGKGQIAALKAQYVSRDEVA